METNITSATTTRLRSISKEQTNKAASSRLGLGYNHAPGLRKTNPMIKNIDTRPKRNSKEKPSIKGRSNKETNLEPGPRRRTVDHARRQASQLTTRKSTLVHSPGRRHDRGPACSLSLSNKHICQQQKAHDPLLQAAEIIISVLRSNTEKRHRSTTTTTTTK